MGTPTHLVHGMGTGLEAPVWPAITHSEAASILASFPGAGALRALTWHSPRPFSAATMVQTDRGEFVLKRHHCRLRTPSGLAQEHRFIDHLRSNGLSVPEIMRTRDGATALVEGDWSYELHRRAHGLDLYRDRQSWTPFLAHRHAFEAGVSLARLHQAAVGYEEPARDAYPLVASFTILPAPDPMAALQAYVEARPALRAFLAQRPWREDMAELFEAMETGLCARLAGQPPLWTHNDWHPSNLLWTAQGAVKTVFDFGLATRTCALHDIATAIERTAIPWLTPGTGEPDVEAALALLRGYVTVSPLGPDEAETIRLLLPLVHVEFALSEIDYFAGVIHEPASADLAWQGYLLGHAAWFRAPPGLRFLEQLASGMASA